MRKYALLYLMSFIAAVAFSGCEAKKEPKESPKTGSKVVAKVNGATITEEDLNFRLRSPHGGKNASGQKQKEIDEAIKEELLYQQGIKLGLDKDPGYQAQIARLERQLANMKRMEMTRRVYNTQVAAKVNLTIQDAKNYYEKHADQITMELHLGIISFNNREGAEEALKKIREGGSFESIARKVMGSQVTAGREPWDIGFVPWDQIPIDFVDSVSLLNPGEVSEVVSSRRTGFQIFKLLSSRKNAKASFDNTSAVIMTRLRDKMVMEAYEHYVEKLMKDAKIEKF